MCVLCILACVRVTLASVLSTAVEIFTVVIGRLFPSRCRQNHLLVTLKRHVPHRKEHAREEDSETGREYVRKIKEEVEGREAECHTEGEILYSELEILNLLQVKEHTVEE